MAKISNPRKKNYWSIQVANLPINPFLFQKATVPERTNVIAEHGDVNYKVKTSSMVEFGNLMLEKLLSTSGADNYFWDWASSVNDAIIGGGLVPSEYKRVLLLSELAEDGTSVLNTYVCTGCFPHKINGQELDRLSGENSIESIEICVDIVEKT